MTILKLVLNKALTPQMILAFNSVYLSHECLFLSLVTLKLVRPVLLRHIRLSWSVSITLPPVSLIFIVWRVTAHSATELDSRRSWRMWRWSGRKSLNAGINNASVQYDSNCSRRIIQAGRELKDNQVNKVSSCDPARL